MDGLAAILAVVAFLLVWGIAGPLLYFFQIALGLLHARHINFVLIPFAYALRLAAAAGAAYLVYNAQAPVTGPPRKLSSDQAFAVVTAIIFGLLVWFTTVIGFYLLAYLPAIRQYPIVQILMVIPVGQVIGLTLGALAGISTFRRVVRPTAAPSSLSPTRSPIVATVRYLDRKIGIGSISISLCLLQVPWSIANVMLLMLLAPHPASPGASPLSHQGYDILTIYYLAPALLGGLTGLLTIFISGVISQKLLGGFSIILAAATALGFMHIFHSA